MAAEPTGRSAVPEGAVQGTRGQSRVVGLMRAHQGRIAWANGAFATIFGYDPDAVVGVSIDDLYVDAASRERIRAESVAVTATGAIWKAEVRLRRRDGTTGLYTVAWARLGADPTEFGGSFVDVSNRVRSIGEVIRSESRLRGVFDAMSEGLVMLGLDACIVDANPAAERILGLARADLLGRDSADASWGSVRHDGSRFPEHERPAMVTLRTGQPVREQVMGVESPGRGQRWIRINTQPMWVGEPPELVGVVATFADVTDERDALHALHAMRDDLQSTLNQLRAITDGIPMSIVLYDADHRIVFANDEYRALGRPGVVAEGSRAEDFLKPAVLRDSADARRRALAGESVRMMILVPKDGGSRRREVTFTPYYDARGEVVGVLALGYDVTELEQSQARLRDVVERLATVRESERREIAMSLHEGPAQDLYAARLAVERLRSTAPDADALVALNDIHAIIEHAVRAIGALTYDLYPTALQHLALGDVLLQHAAKFQERSGIRVAVCAPAGLPSLDPERKLLFFRAAQEALTNVWRHAGARHATVALATREGAFWLVVEDDGTGLVAGSDTKVGSLGLLAMRERFAAVGGGLELGPSLAGGARIGVWVPLR
jgi:PAS domain S-box-containing protein